MSGVDQKDYMRQYESVMEDEDAAAVPSDIKPYSIDRSSPSSYSKRLADVLGSDEDIDDVGRDDGRIEEEEEEAADEVTELANGTHSAGDTSIATEAGTSISSLSLRPLRPWHFPAPRRLRSLRSDQSNMSVESPSQIFSGSPSVISDEGSGRMSWMLPYGEPIPTSNYNGHGNSIDMHQEAGLKKSSADLLHRSFVRMSRLCTLNEQEGSPTVMAVAGGILAVGMKEGRVGLYDRQRGWTGTVSVEGVITALAISSDKTFLAIGTSLGHIFLYDLAKLTTPSRHVKPVTPQSVASGRSEGHLEGSKVLHLAFVGARHTAIVSADENGLSFYHSLGKILGVSSNDTLRILGRYPDLLDQDTNKKSTILGMTILPLSSLGHISDATHFVALLTPTKMVLVGLKPNARTWYRQMAPNKVIEGGCLAWLPCTKVSQPSSATSKAGVAGPTLAFAFGQRLRFIRLMQSGSGTTAQVAVIEEPGWSWTHPTNIEAMQWLSPDFLVLYSASSLSLFDVRRKRCTEEQTTTRPVSNVWIDVGQKMGVEIRPLSCASFKAHKGHLFILTAGEVLGCSLITWADRILALVSAGDFLGAIELATSLLQDSGSGGGSRVGLPEAFADQKPLLSSRLIELMRASAAYVFSEDRMKDDIANQAVGMDRTPLFTGLARVCAEACLALDEFSFLFGELFDIYAEAGIEAVFADQMEEFIVSGQIKELPIPIVQRLIAVRKRQKRYDLAERIIWNVDPTCLDLDQAINLCLEKSLHDALIYIYTRALHDFVGPIVELMPLIKSQDGEAYRVMSYLSITLIGLSYPNQQKLDEKEAELARSSIYSFLFSGRCIIWPPGAGGKLILTGEEGQEFAEPTFPYLTLLLGFDAEALLDALDVAFEDSWLDEGTMTRQGIVSVLFEMVDNQHAEQIFLAIFIARNAPKFSQFIRLSAKQVQTLLTVLSVPQTDEDGEGTLEDRQYAVECLLSAYSPSTANLLNRFEQAGFVGILRRVYRSEARWDKLAQMIVAGPHNDATLDGVTEVLRRARWDERVETIVLHSLPALVDVDVQRTVETVQRYMAGKQHEAIHQLERSPHRQLSYLRTLMESSKDIADDFRQLFVSLVCSIEPQGLVKALDERGADFFDLRKVAEVTREEGVIDGLLWARDRLGETQEALQEMDQFIMQKELVLRNSIDGDRAEESIKLLDSDEILEAKEQIHNAVEMAVRICTERAQEALWIQLLTSVLHLSQNLQESMVGFSRSLLEDTLSSFVSSTSAEQASFSSLFKQLTSDREKTMYRDVRVLSDGMMAANKLREELLSITNRLFDRDIHRELLQLTQKQRVGWRPTAITAACSGCGQSCIGDERRAQKEKDRRKIQAPPQQLRSPFLDRAVSPRPDKGKGVVRGDSSEGQMSSNGFFDMTSTSSSSLITADPIDVFSALPPVDLYEGNQNSADAYRYKNNAFGTSDDDIIEQVEEADLDEEDGLYESLIVCSNGLVWHRRCAPVSMTGTT